MRDAAAAVEFEYPTGHVVEEVAIVGDDQDRAGIVAQVALEPVHRLGVEMVGRFVEQQQFGLFEQQLAQRDAALLAAGEPIDRPVVGRAAERVHRLLDLAVEVPQVLRLDLVLQAGHLVRRLLGIVHREVVVAVEDVLLGLDAEHDVFSHVERGLQGRLLRQVADTGAVGDETLAPGTRCRGRP